MDVQMRYASLDEVKKLGGGKTVHTYKIIRTIKMPGMAETTGTMWRSSVVPGNEVGEETIMYPAPGMKNVSRNTIDDFGVFSSEELQKFIRKYQVELN